MAQGKTIYADKLATTDTQLNKLQQMLETLRDDAQFVRVEKQTILNLLRDHVSMATALKL
jgi:hypothetical protein